MSAKTTIQPASEPPPPLVPREWRLRLDPLLLLATLGLVVASLLSLNGATENDIPGQPQRQEGRTTVDGISVIGAAGGWLVGCLQRTKADQPRGANIV